MIRPLWQAPNEQAERRLFVVSDLEICLCHGEFVEVGEQAAVAWV